MPENNKKNSGMNELVSIEDDKGKDGQSKSFMKDSNSEAVNVSSKKAKETKEKKENPSIENATIFKREVQEVRNDPNSSKDDYIYKNEVLYKEAYRNMTPHLKLPE